MSDEPAGAAPGDEIVFDGRRFKVRVRTLPQSVGGVQRFEIVDAPAAAAVVPILAGEAGDDPHVILVEQERPAIGQRTLEIPAGLLNSGEDQHPETTAARELREETGYSAEARALRHLTSIYPSPGICTEIIHIYLASEVVLDGKAPGPHDPSEIAGLRVLPLRDAIDMVAQGAIDDAKTIIGLLLARDALAESARQHSQTPGSGGPSMPVDPTNMPFGGLEPRGTASGATPGDVSLESILGMEFNYASVTAYQAMEDRARIFNLYLLLVGVLASALTAVYQLGIKGYAQPLTILLLLLAGVLGVVFFMQIIRLRRAFRDSVIAMNRIKEYYLKRLLPVAPDATQAFHWRLRSIPSGERLGSVTFLVSFTIAFLGSLCFAGALMVGIKYGETQAGWRQGIPILPDTTTYLLAFVVLALSLILHTLYYRRKLSKKADDREIEQEEQSIGPTARK